MTTTYTPAFPRGAALADEIAAIERQSVDEQIRRTLQERIAMADAPDAKFIPHEEVFAKSRAALLEPAIITGHGTPSVGVKSISVTATDSAMSINQHAKLDDIKHKIACEVLATFSLADIKAHSKANIERWRASGAGDPVYDEWYALMEDKDERKLLNAMVGLNDNSNRLRQSQPYVGMLPKAVVRKFNEEIAWKIS